MNNLPSFVWSIVIAIFSVYIYSAERRIREMHELIQQHGNEIKKGKVELESTTKALTYVRVKLEVTRKELKQVKEESVSTRNALRHAQVAINSTRVPINVIAKDNMIAKDNTRREDIDHIRADVNASRDELNAIIKGKI